MVSNAYVNNCYHGDDVIAVKVVAECLGRSKSIATQDVARKLLHQLAVVSMSNSNVNSHSLIGMSNIMYE